MPQPDDYTPPQTAPFGMVDWRESGQLPRNGYYRRRDADVALLAVHHPDAESSAKAVNTFHTTGNYFDGENAPHIAYHYYIENSGLIVLCNHTWEQSWHATRANRIALGVCVNGDLDKRAPTTAQRLALTWLLDALCVAFGLAQSKVFGHGELTQYGNSTACPGSFLLPLVKQYRAGQAVPPPATDWRVKYIELAGVTERHRKTLEWVADNSGDAVSKLHAAAALAGQWMEE